MTRPRVVDGGDGRQGQLGLLQLGVA